MKPDQIIFTPKLRDILKSKKRIIHAEGVTGSGKSFDLGLKFFFDVFDSPRNKKQYVIAASSVTVAEKMFIQTDSSFFNLFNIVCEHYQQGVGGNRMIITTPVGKKIVYLVGYDDKSRFKQILGLGIHGFLVEEIHTAGDEFIREMFTRVYRDGGFLYTSSNGGLPDLTVYKDYLNKARPHPDYAHEVPDSTMNYLNEKEPDDDFEFWYYTFHDNPMMKQDQIDKMYSAHPVGSFEYNSKILGIRGFVEGAIYHKHMSPSKNMVQHDLVYNNPQSPYPMVTYTIGIDVGATDFTVISLVGFTRFYREAIVLDAVEINDSGVDEIWDLIQRFLDPYYDIIGRRIHGVFIDSASQILKNSLAPRFMQRYALSIANSYKYTIKERVEWGIRFIHQGRLKFSDKARHIYNSFTKALYNENSRATDIREFPNHKDKDNIDSVEYAITPFIREMLHVT